MLGMSRKKKDLFSITATKLSTIFQFRSRSVVQYTHFERTQNYSRSFLQIKSADDLAKQSEDKLTYSGEMRPGAKKRLTKAIENIVMLARPKEHKFISKRTGQQRTIKYDLNFITLTIHYPTRKIAGKEGHKVLLEPFLLWMTRHHDLNLYIWKAEIQAKRKDQKQLHYHITSDTFIDKDVLRNKWNELQKNAGLLEPFFNKHGHYDANSTDVHSVYKIRNTAGYLKKCIFTNYDIRGEMAKDNPDKISIQGKVWDCSLILKAAQYFKTDGSTGTEKFLLQAERGGEAHKSYTDDHCTIYSFKKPARFVMSEYDKFLYNEHLTNARHYQRKKPAKKIKLTDKELQDIEDALQNLRPKVVEKLPDKKEISFETLMEMKWKQQYFGRNGP